MAPGIALLALLLLVLGVGHHHHRAAAAAASAAAERAPAETELDTAAYFSLMREYLGHEAFARHPCLEEQEKNGWQSEHSGIVKPLTIGVEGSGHHAIETLFRGHVFTTVRGDGGQDSIPNRWRQKQQLTKKGTHNKDIAGLVAKGRLLLVLLRYPPSSLLSSINRFQNRSANFDQVTTGADEVFTLHDSVQTIEAALRFPNFDCGRLLVLPFELLTQRPMSLYGPLSQVLQLNKMGDAGFSLLRSRLQAMEDHETVARARGGSRYFIKESQCQDLGLSTTHTTTQAPTLLRPLQQIRQRDPDLLQRPCADRLYAFASEYFDELRYMFPGVYPSQQLIAASAEKHPFSGLHFSDLD